MEQGEHTVASVPRPSRTTPALRLTIASALVGAVLAIACSLAKAPFESARIVDQPGLNSSAERSAFAGWLRARGFRVEEVGSTFHVITQGSTPEEAARHAVEIGHALGVAATEWRDRRRSEVVRESSAIELQLKASRSKFAVFDHALLTGEVSSLRESLTENVAEAAKRVAALTAELASIDSSLNRRTSTQDMPVLVGLERELQQTLIRYTEEHPKVKELRASIAALKNNPEFNHTNQVEPAAAGLSNRRTSVSNALAAATAQEQACRTALARYSERAVEYSRLQAEHAALLKERDRLVATEVSLNAATPELSETALIAESRWVPAWREAGMWGFLGAIIGGLGAFAVGRRRELRSRALAGSVPGTFLGLPVLATLPDLQSMNADQRDYWALETLELLRRTAGGKRRGAFVCGFIAAESGAGCTTWMDCLASAGVRNGHRVLVVCQSNRQNLLSAPSYSSTSETLFAAEPNEGVHFKSMARYSVTDVVGGGFQKQWERAFTVWRDEDDALILVELPPATTVDALVLSPALPSVVWVASRTTDTTCTQRCVTALRNVGCNLVGAVLNGAAALAFLAWMAFDTGPARAQEPTVSNVKTNTASRIAPWQERLTLGPGDVLDISIFGQPDSTRPGTMIGPDGRLSYLQAKDIPATGLTVDELRAALEKVLSRVQHEPRVVVVPNAFRSKKYYLLGSVGAPGAFILDRPTSILEAVVKARGLVSGSGAQSTLVMSDLNRAFLVRRQPTGEFARESVDFEKLFLRGALEENRQLAPDDYLYFPPLSSPEVYVVGEVGGAGAVPYTKELTVLGAIAARGGFTEGAFRQRVLVVRGSLNNPETFVVDSAKALRAASVGFQIQPRDIVYVSRKPWAKAEEILQAASSDFVRAVVVTWTGREIQPILK